MQKITKRYSKPYSKRYAGGFHELKATHNLVLCGLMAALAVVLNYTTSIFITPNIRIGFSGLPNRVVEYLFGPYVGAIFGATLDILKYLLKPDAAPSSLAIPSMSWWLGYSTAQSCTKSL